MNRGSLNGVSWNDVNENCCLRYSVQFYRVFKFYERRFRRSMSIRRITATVGSRFGSFARLSYATFSPAVWNLELDVSHLRWKPTSNVAVFAALFSAGS